MRALTLAIWLRKGEPVLVKRNLPKGVHRVRRKLKCGAKYHFYAWRSGPKFWEDVIPYPVVPEFFQAFSACTALQKTSANLVDDLVMDFLSSDAMPPRARSRKMSSSGSRGFRTNLVQTQRRCLKNLLLGLNLILGASAGFIHQNSTIWRAHTLSNY